MAALGFDYAEIPLDALAALPESDFKDFLDYVEGRQIKIAACNRMLPDDLPITGPSVNATALHGYLKHALGRAQQLGVKVIALDGAKSRSVPMDGDFPFAWRQLGNFLRLLQGHARDCGMTVALEPLRKADCTLLNLVSEATLIAGLLQLENIAVAAHSGHMAMASEPMSALRRAAPLLKHVYLENALTRVLPRPGDGEDYGRLLETLADIGYAGGVTLCGDITETFVEDAAAALKHIRALGQRD
ncbi:MAG: sugar phosphate isomerase/epimerase [Clostridia bacterium]|nr:sugar phosphate isomerase/epimerase [Clostridia bacterium]